jgi:hypothetical protein
MVNGWLALEFRHSSIAKVTSSADEKEALGQTLSGMAPLPV